MPRKAKKADDEPRATTGATAVAVDLSADAGKETGEVTAEALQGFESLRATLTQAVTFRLDGQLYGFPIEVVQEIQQLVEFSPLPDAAPAQLGLIDVRGIVVPAIDLRVLIGLQPRPFSLETPMIFCRVRGQVVCVVVDEVEDVIDLPETGLQPPSGLYSLAGSLLGTCRLPQGLVLLLDIERLVPDVALAAAEASAGGR